MSAPVKKAGGGPMRPMRPTGSPLGLNLPKKDKKSPKGGAAKIGPGGCGSLGTLPRGFSLPSDAKKEMQGKMKDPSMVSTPSVPISKEYTPIAEEDEEDGLIPE